ncbi:MAG: cytochrome c [Chitinophagaceae bacterium]
MPHSFLLLIFLFTSTHAPAQPDVAYGQVIYRQLCKNCHKLDRNAHGPMLEGVLARWHGNETALKSYILNSPRMIAAGDTIAVKIWKQWKHRKMPPFPNLTDKDLNCLLAFIEQKH